ncbi:MAG: hypothetical protein Q8M71_06585 [Thermodesulfovibrionales bacterium]|nr:hypothetical protein [Thermodesulfovibrionales bacterium]
MYATIEKNKLHISLAEFYIMDWYGGMPFKKESFKFKYGNLEIDVHKNGGKYLTGFIIDPRAFIVDYLKIRYKKNLRLPKNILSVSVDSSKHTNLFSVDFLKTIGFVVDGMEKDLIFPMFVKQGKQIRIQGVDVLDPVSVIVYLVKRFNFRGTTLVRMGNEVYNFKNKRKWKIKR